MAHLLLFSQLLLVLLLGPVAAQSALPIIRITGPKFFKGNGDQFYIKGVMYAGPPDNSVPHTDPLANSAQCALDAPLMRSLGANTVRVRYTDVWADHDACMQTLADNGIYVVLNIAESGTVGSRTWDDTLYRLFTPMIDRFAKYDNLLGFFIGDEDISDDSSLDCASSLKAAVRDMKAYIAAREYRSIPLGYAAADLADIRKQQANYLVCGGNPAESVDFYGVNLFSWCGDSSYLESGYNLYTDDLKSMPVPIILSEDGCFETSPRTFSDQQAVFGPEMEDIWSGAIINGWAYAGFNYDLVNYSVSSSAATRSPLPDYSNLQSQWALATPEGVASSDYTWSGTTPACPASTASWTVDPSEPLPTIAGLNLATVEPASSSGPSNGSSSALAPSASSSGAGGNTTAHSGSSSGLSQGATIGIGVGVGVGGLVIALIALFLLYRWRKNKRQEASTSTSNATHEKAEMYAGPVDERIKGKSRPKHELPSTRTMSGKPTPHQLDNGHPTREASSHELSGQVSSNAPWSHNPDGYMPPELNSSEIVEVGTASIRKDGYHPIDHLFDSSQRDTTTSSPGTTAVASEQRNRDIPANASPADDDDAEELAEEADVAVQELGLISVRKRALTSQAAAIGQKPEEVEGRKGEEFRELIQREERVRARLERIDRQRTPARRR
ncbi:uncharacterized protein Z518_08621 [Rhinocladiella mackenziei CBS 650.93]|uniref:1,3-beta-glucanosyltransferase n=1 Tax=Rhinocladiella mackenziei CBS 650.93 TaxID=1442369 RepID=A0A0D2I9U7_9EURO|nr:uncharacterized protein Z518_08621 [Rhinocladiella mackenziei CBS 650.93]KIX02679.1 hypothetical protein Z518_08621 [Rhinocladiella mackenziei CBS 650.93]